MPVIFTKVLRDMTVRYRSTLLAILALTIGLWGVGTLLASLHIMTNDLSENFSRTNPLHISVQSENFENLDIAELLENPDISAAEFRDKTILRIEVRPDQWLTLWINAVEDFEQLSLAKFIPQSGRFPPPHRTILIERDNLLISDLSVGHVARVQSRGNVLETEISGVVFDAAQAPSTQDAIIYGYTDKQNYSRLTGLPADQRLIIRFNNVASKQDVEKKFEELSDYLTLRGIKVSGFNIPKFEEHPHQFQLATLLYLNATIGLLAFLMSMVLMSQLMSSIFAQEIRQIGVMKAIGATRGQVIRSYVVYIMAMSSVSIVIGLPLAISTAKAYSTFVAGILNFDVLTSQLPVAIYVVITLLGFGLPLVFSLPALRRGTKISVNEALSDYGIGTHSTAKPRNSATIANSSILSLSIRNIFRRKGRVVVTMATMALGVAIFQTGFDVRASLGDFLDNNSRSMKYDIKVVLEKKLPLEVAAAPYQNITAIKSIEGWVGGVGRVQSGLVSNAAGIGVIAAPHNTELKDRDMLHGSWLSGADDLEFVVNQQAATSFKPLIIGQIYPLELGGAEVSAKLVGVVREFDVAKIYLDIDDYNNLVNPSGNINSLMISLDDRSLENVIAVKKEIERVIELSGVDVLDVMSQAERADIIFRHLDIILAAILFLSLLVLMVSSLGMASAMGINVIERTREIGVLRAIGATPKVITQLFVLEGFIVSVMSVAIGIALALPLSGLAAIYFGELILGENTPLDFAFSEIGLVITLLVTLLFGYVASRVPAGSATKTTVREALAYE